MRLSFNCTTNHDYVAINTLKLMLPTGSTITVDRSMTQFNVDGDKLVMEWHGCYLWAIDDHNIFGAGGCHDITANEFQDLTEGAYVFFELEDDVDPDYFVTIENWDVD